MEIFGFGSKKTVKEPILCERNGHKTSTNQNESVYNVPETIKVPESSIHNEMDPDRYNEESDMRRGEHYNRQRRRSRYNLINDQIKMELFSYFK